MINSFEKLIYLSLLKYLRKSNCCCSAVKVVPLIDLSTRLIIFPCLGSASSAAMLTGKNLSNKTSLELGVVSVLPILILPSSNIFTNAASRSLSTPLSLSGFNVCILNSLSTSSLSAVGEIIAEAFKRVRYSPNSLSLKVLFSATPAFRCLSKTEIMLLGIPKSAAFAKLSMYLSLLRFGESTIVFTKEFA